MKRFQHTRWLALLLAGAVWTSSVGMSAFAAEADSTVSADIVVDENNTDQPETGTEQEAAQPTTAESAAESSEEQKKDAAGEKEEDQEQADSSADGQGSSEENPEQEEEATADREKSGAADTEDDSRSAETAENSESADTAENGESAESAENGSSTDAANENPEESESGTMSEENPDGIVSDEDSIPESETVLETTVEEYGTAAAEAAAGQGAITGLSVAISGAESSFVLSEGSGKTLTAVITFTADDQETAAAIEDSVAWTTSNSGVAKLSAANPVISKTAANSTGTDTTGSTSPIDVKITQNVTVSAVKEGAAVIEVEAGEKACSVAVTVNPVPVKLGKSGNLYWSDTTVLKWDAVKNATEYLVTVYLWNGTKKYSKSLTVKGKRSCDLEDCIVALVKANKSSLKGASYRITASVRAISSNTRYYTNGAAVGSPDLRYLKTTYQDAVGRNGWYLRSGNWYYYSAGKKQTGWVTFQGNKYYLDDEGRMLKNCWVGKYYVKSDGSMAKDEWVDGYKYYVNAKGCKVAGASLYSSKQWVKTSKGWRFKKKNGQYAKNMWVKFNRSRYYFDKNGYLKTGWLTQDGKKYYLNKSGGITTGLGIPKTGWTKIGKYYYWFDSNGEMAVNSWVDRNQYYVNAKGHRLYWITYANLRNVNTSNRLGLYVYNSGSAPEQSIAGFDAAYKQDNRIMVVNLRFTKDGVPVCAHDDAVSYARYSNGGRPGSRPTISKMTLKELQKYDYGIYRGSKYKGTQLLTLAEMSKWIKNHPDTELYIEVKGSSMSTAQIKKTAAVLKKYGVTDRSSAIFSVTKSGDTRAKRMHKAAPTLRIGITASSVGTLALAQLKSAKGNKNEVFLWCWANTRLNSSIVKRLRKLNVQYEFGTMDTFDDIIKYYSKGSAYSYNSGVETEGAVFQTLLKEATCHSKAKWVNTKKGWKYQLIDQTYAENQWIQISGKYYHFNKSGLMQTGWLNLGGKLYYLNAKGVRVTGTVTIAKHKYLFGDDGVMIKKIK